MHSCLRHRPQCGVGVIRACSVQEQRPVRRKRSSQLSKTPTSYTFPFPLPAWERGKRRKQVQAIPQCEDGRLSLFTLVCVSVAQPCLTLCNPMDCSPSGSSVREISQVRILEWVVISFSRGSSQLTDQTCVSCIGRQIVTEPPGKPNRTQQLHQQIFIVEK